MKELIAVNIFLMIVLPMYITYTRFGEIIFGEFYSTLTIVLIVVSLFYSAVSIVTKKI